MLPCEGCLGLLQKTIRLPRVKLVKASVAVVAGLFLAVGCFTEAFAEQKWLLCAFTEKSSGDDPFHAIAPVERILVYDEDVGSVAEYVEGDLVPSLTRSITVREISAQIRIAYFDINRMTGRAKVFHQVGLDVLFDLRGSCSPIQAMTLLRPKF
jgi:hypothetical protein